MSTNLTINFLKNTIDELDRRIKCYKKLIEDSVLIIDNPEEIKNNLMINRFKKDINDLLKERNDNLEKMAETKLLIELRKYKNILYY